MMNLEFPETKSTIAYSNLPFINLALSATETSPTNGGVLSSGNTTSETAAATTTIYRSAWFTNWYDPTTATRVQRSADTGFLGYYLPTTPTITLNSSNAVSHTLLPIIDIRYGVGDGIHNYSSLTDVYQVSRTPNYGGAGDESTLSNGDTYVFLTIGIASQDVKTIAIKKA